ncbi:sialate O-acetylesterase [Rhizobium sp. S163]|uniref:sialate O-acetylesterase n=1 Tax=Rhizobium sp. S163 TaxID=3055039 RepID=UPI0025A9417C|nr:sialate O-acetylesterase [Rhizobium sp. S163]MDM9644990.1 sialate O-acetylesterase [Rhizobium sp. S163]
MLRNLIFGCAALLAVFVSGGMSAKHEMFPWPQLSALKHQFTAPEAAAPSRYTFDDKKRLIGDETKMAVSCPVQSDRTAVLLVLGQSNAANDGGQRHRSQYGERVINEFDGHCFTAASPLLGSTDTKGEYWTDIGNSLIASGRYDNVIIAPVAYSGSEVARWAEGGDLNPVLAESTKKLHDAGYRVTNVLWVQGEADFVLGTSSEIYEQRFLSMVGTLRGLGVAAPVYISVATKCLEPANGGFKQHTEDNPVLRAQLALPKSGNGIVQGVNSDALLNGDDRYDDCHIGGSGAEKVAAAWRDLLLAGPQLQASSQ